MGIVRISRSNPCERSRAFDPCRSKIEMESGIGTRVVDSRRGTTVRTEPCTWALHPYKDARLEILTPANHTFYPILRHLRTRFLARYLPDLINLRSNIFFDGNNSRVKISFPRSKPRFSPFFKRSTRTRRFKFHSCQFHSDGSF